MQIVVFKATEDVYDSVLDYSTSGKLTEKRTYFYQDEELDEQRYLFGKMAFEYSQSFESDIIEVVAFTSKFLEL